LLGFEDNGLPLALKMTNATYTIQNQLIHTFSQNEPNFALSFQILGSLAARSIRSAAQFLFWPSFMDGKILGMQVPWASKIRDSEIDFS
jgi:hypothetical protein